MLGSSVASPSFFFQRICLKVEEEPEIVRRIRSAVESFLKVIKSQIKGRERTKSEETEKKETKPAPKP